MDSASADPDAAAAAAAWYARLHADDATPADRAAFGRWLSAEDAHDRAWHELVSATRVLDDARNDPALLAMIAATRGDVRAAPARRRWPMAAAAAVLLSIGGTTALVLDKHAAPAATEVAAVRYVTPVGRSRDITLSDGTLMTLDADSAVRVSAPGATRRVAIDRGQAFFQVAHDAAHPFVVSAAGNSVTALGTQFAVRTASDRVVVNLVEGSVRVDTPVLGRTTTLIRGNTLTIGASGLHLTRAGADIATGWRKGELTFDATPLGEVVAELNRYSVQRIELTDPRLAKRVFSGVLRTGGGGTALADALSAYGIARVDHADRTRLVLAPLS
ncbi:FecR family protein [Sphingomonas sp. R86521]|uniref:FecR family protein n=1 Tax=Sphingomonas sp. R86521 TaxID=3093860 RepID=UPI0036D38D26